MTEMKKKLSPVQKRQQTERVLGFIAIITLIAAGIIGALRAGTNLMPAIIAAIPGTDHIEEISGDFYRSWGDKDEEEMLGYVALGEAGGYGGPMIMAVGVSPAGEIIGAVVAAHKETPSWMNRVLDAEFVEFLFGKQYSDPFNLEQDVDGITGATYTTRAIMEAVMRGSHAVAGFTGLPVVETPTPKVVFGPPEIILLLLFAVGYIGHKSGFKYKKQVRWGSMIVGLVALGFVYNSPLTLILY